MTVEVINYSQSLADIVTAAQQVQEPVQQGDKPATAAWLQSKLQDKCQSAALQVPDLMLVFGRTFSLAGYPPWPIRVTEIYHMGRLSQVSDSLLQNTWHQYSRTVQRFGS